MTTRLLCFVIVLCMAIADVVTGLAYALFTHNFSSRIMREGGMHKFGELCLAAMSYGLEWVLTQIGIADVPIVQMVTVYCVIMEIGSIFENIKKLNPEYGDFLDALWSKIRGVHGDD